MGRPVTIIATSADTWDAIAARELGNATLGPELAGLNGYPAHSGVPIGAEIRIPYREHPDESADADGSGSSSSPRSRSRSPRS